MNEVHQRDGRRVAYIINSIGHLPGGRTIDDTKRRLNHIPDKGEVALHIPVIEYLNRPSGKNLLQEEARRHVRTPPRSVHGKIAQARCRQMIQFAVGMSHKLVRFLGRPVKADRAVYLVCLAERDMVCQAIHAA